MYSDWPSELIPQNGWGDEHSISAFKDALPWSVSRDFVAGTAKHLYEKLGLNKPRPPAQMNVTHEKQLQILMPALGYGLSFPLNEHEILRNCVYVYNEWLSALLPDPKPSVPKPLLKDPNHYARIIIKHFYYLFVPRTSHAVDEINKQALLCHRVLRTLQDIAKHSTCLDGETWQTLLLFLLHINSALLAPPTIKNDAGEQLGERVLGVLFETWLLACAKCFPSPPLWNALKESCLRWRHRVGLIEQWNRINVALTARLLTFMYGPEFVRLNIGDEDMSIIPGEMSKDCIAQVWFRILHIIGNPVDLSKQMVISKTPAFLKYAITAQYVIEPGNHPCLAALPSIFSKAMKGVSTLVDAFLGVPQTNEYLFKGKPKCNSILHLFGPWLFEGALIGCSFNFGPKLDHSNSTSSNTSARRPTSVYVNENRKSSDSSLAGDSDKALNLSPSQFQGGRAEALGALCRIFCSKKTGEEILPVYLARFYLAINEGLKLEEEVISPLNEDQKTSLPYKRVRCSETAASILFNGTDLFRLDLEGITSLMPAMVNVLSLILLECWDHPTFPPQQATNLKVPALRRAATQILLSLLPLPLHFQNLSIKELGNGGHDKLHLSQLRPQLVNLLSGALRIESDGTNIQMLLAGLVFCVQDASICESMGTPSEHTVTSEREAVILSSAASDTMSSLGTDMSWTDDLPETDLGQFPPAIPKHLSDPDTSHGLYVRSIYLVSHCLMSSWTKDVNVSLAGLELLSSVALLHFGEQEVAECRCAVRWLCDYIMFQCSRPPQAHSKDLHSMIVAAFHCASVWLVAHSYLLEDSECLATILEVIELGISGSKSTSKSGEPTKFKHQKEAKPISMRVRDAAEALLSCVLSQVGSFPSMCGVESLSSLLDESVLLKHCNSYDGPDHLTKATALAHFRYFVTQNSILFALLEQPLVNHEESEGNSPGRCDTINAFWSVNADDPQPSVTALIRGPFGRSAWTMQLRHLPRHKSSSKMHISNPGRPLPINDVSIKRSTKHKFFPDSVDRIPMCKADKSIPTLEAVIAKGERSSVNQEKMLQILEHQQAFEESVYRQASDPKKSPYVNVEPECSAPPLCQEFQTARLLLSHLGLLTLENIQVNPESNTPVPYLVALDTAQPGFLKDLEHLDNCNNRTVDSVHVFYVKAGQNSIEDILSNTALTEDLHSQFLELLEGLGWPVSISKHCGWTGNVATSFVAPRQCDSEGDTNTSVGVGYDGSEKVIYWADCLSELAFIVPTLRSDVADKGPLASEVTSTGGSLGGSEKSDSLPPMEGEVEASSLSSHTSQVSTGSDNRGRRLGRQATHNHSICRVFVVWLESLDDAAVFPASDLLSVTSTGMEPPNWKEKDVPIFIIYIHPLTNGLFRVKLQGKLTKLSLAGPLVDDQVVSRRVLGILVRQTALNICRRRRLECDSYQPPHVRRKFRIQDMTMKYQGQMDEGEFYTHLFTSPLG